MSTAFPSLTWEGTLREFLLHLQATRARKTFRYYDVQLRHTQADKERAVTALPADQ